MNNFNIYCTIILTVAITCGTVEAQASTEHVVLDKNILANATAYIPPQCYTKTVEPEGKVYNPCYVCHTRSVEPNYVNDHQLQLSYAFPESARINPWINLFEDRRQRIAALSDEETIVYVRKSNYIDDHGSLILTNKLQNLPTTWDYNKNNKWDGFTPDCFFNFDDKGFDRSPDSSFSGWRAFGYHPFPATYWPTNGATGDVMIRLPESFRKTAAGTFDQTTYEINLAIVESLLSKRNILIEPTDEKLFGVDLNQDGTLNEAKQITYHWPGSDGKSMSYVGIAGQQLAGGKRHLAGGIFPVGTEFLHSIRYLDVVDHGNITLSARMKELQYMKKQTWQTYSNLEERTLSEMKERHDFPDRSSQFIGNAELGVYNGSGWLLQGFIEDAAGELRPQSYEETISCVGCHGGIGATTDSVFTFSRKISDNSTNHGWFHWNKNYLHDIQEPKTELHRAGIFYEYSYYLMYNNTGNDFRNNPEVISRYTLPGGSPNLKLDELIELQSDVARLLLPSPERALQLNKAYRTLVIDQDFIHGRDINIDPVTTIHKETEIDQPTSIKTATSPVGFGNHFGSVRAAHTTVVPAEHSRKAKEVLGTSIHGPDGKFYVAEWTGIINKSSYSSTINGAKMVFPDRLTLPTRQIIPTSNNPSCKVCHRVVSEQKANIESAEEQLTGRKQLTSKGNNHTGRFSPDGSHIAFVSNRSGSEQVWLMDVDGQNQRPLTSGPTEHSWPNWSHDSRQLVFLAHDPAINDYAIKTYNLDKKSEKTLVSSNSMINRPTYNPTDNIIAYSAQTDTNWDIWLISEDDNQKYRLTTAPDMESNPLWSPDGQVLAYKIAPAGGKYSLTSENFLTFSNGYDEPAVHLWQGPESVQMNDWSPDGSKITYTAETISGTSGRERVTYSALVSDLSLTDGKAITTHTLFAAQGYTLGDRGPVFSPNGRYVAFWGWNPDYKAGLWLCDLDQKRTIPLPSQGFDMYPQWSANSESLLFEARRGGNSQLMIAEISALLAQYNLQLTSH